MTRHQDSSRRGMEGRATDSPGARRPRQRAQLILFGAGFCLIVAAGLTVAILMRRGNDGGSASRQSDKEEAPPASIAELPASLNAEEQKLRSEQLAVVTQLVKDFPQSDDAVYLLGIAYKDQGNSAEAVRYWEQSLKMDPSRTDACDSLGYEALLREDFDRAAGFLRKALAVDPRMSSARQNLALVLIRQGKAPEAVEELEKDPERSAMYHRILAEAYQAIGDHEKAKRSFESAIAVSPNLAEAHYGLARTLARLGQAEASREHMEAFNRIRAQDQDVGRHWRRNFDPTAVTLLSVAHTHTDAGRVYAALGRMEKAEQLWLRAAALDAKNAVCRAALAQLYLGGNRNLPRAKELAGAAARLEPNGPAYALFAQICERSGDRATALDAIRRAVELDPRNPEYRRILELLSKDR